MQRQRTFLQLGFLIAVVTAATLLVSGFSVPVAGTILLLWLGSLWLSASRSPPRARAPEPSPFTRKNLGAVFELSSSPLLLTERDKVVVANTAARSLIGEHIVGQNARMALRSPDAVELLSRETGGSCIVRNLTRPQDSWQMERRVIEPELAVVELRDRSAEEVVSRAHTDFVANASHELRTPLAAIIGYVETLREETGELPLATVQRFLTIIGEEAQRMQHLIGDLISLSRIEAEKHAAPSTRVQLSDLVERAAKDAAGPQRMAYLRFNLQPDLVTCGDAPQLEQVARNLVDNAFKYGAAGTPVSIATAAVGNYIQFTVKDRGMGIGKEHLPHLTRRFYRTDPGRSRMSGGTGLGLAIVKHIVERHRGRLDIQSVVGQGTSVSVRLPMHQRPEMLAESSTASTAEA